jgi:hypothetical protein
VRCRACNRKMEVLRSKHGGFEDLCYLCRSYVARDMRAKMYGKDEESVSQEQILVDMEPKDREDDWLMPDRNSEWGSILEGMNDD